MRRLLVGVIVLLAGCSVEVAPSTRMPVTSPGSSPALSLPSAEPAQSEGPINPGFGLPYACASAPFDVRIFSTFPAAETSNDPAVNGLRRVLVLDPMLPRAGWWLTARSEGEAEFAARDARGALWYVRVEPGNGTWDMPSWGGCGPVLQIAGVSTLRWSLDPDSPLPAPDARVIRALVTESCVPQPLAGRLEAPIVRATPELVLVAFTARPPAGQGAWLPQGRPSGRVAAVDGPDSLAELDLHDICMGASSATVEVDLGEPLGDRLLVDGSQWPGRDPRQPSEP